jgi:hypothetical protein
MIAPRVYRIHWRSKITGISGNGTQFMEYHFAKREIKNLNKKYPELDHWMD